MTRTLLVAARELHFDHRGQQLSDREGIGVARVVHRHPQQRRRRSGVALCKSQHRKAGLRILLMGRGALERISGRGEITTPQLDLTELVPSLTDMTRRPAFERDHRQAKLRLRTRPIAAQPRDLSSMHAAITRKVAHPRTARTDHRLLGPLRCASDVTERLTQADRVAIDPRRHDRPEKA